MDATSVTVGVPVRDLDAARGWYEALLGIDGAALEPVDGIVEYEVGGCWLQLLEGQPGGDWVFRIGVADVAAARDRLVGLGVQVSEIVHIAGAVAYCDLSDPDGNRLSLYTVV